MNNRIEQLDSIRGLAAFSVVLSHIPFFAFPMPYVMYKALVWLGINNGHKAVMLFFLLSGFVLSLPFLKRKEINYVPYVIKRVLRIYIPFLFAIIFAMILSQMFWQEKVGIVGEWDLLWQTQISVKLVKEHVLFLGNYHTNAFNGVIWSLIHELRISLFFPLIILLVKRFNWKINLLICLLLSMIAGLNAIYQFEQSNGYNTTYFKTIEYTVFFIFGSLMAKNKVTLIKMYREKHRSYKWCLFLVSLFLYNFSEITIGKLYELSQIEVLSTQYGIITEYGIALGCCGIVICAMGSIKLEKVLLFRPLIFLGRISYSLYLFHLPIILVSIYLFHEVLPLWIISILAIVLSFILSTVAWLFIELPSQKLGRDLARRASNKDGVAYLKKKAV